MSGKFITLLVVLFAVLGACLAQEKPESCVDFECPAACRETKVTADSAVVVVCEGIVCPTYYKPVCSEEGVTYANPCLLHLADAKYSYEGECVRPTNPPTVLPTSRPDTCPGHYDPVCGTDGKTYGNACRLGLAGVGYAHDGECEEEPTDAPTDAPTEAPTRRPDTCPGHYVPVCSTDGKTYGNACRLGLAGVGYAHDGECEEPTEAPTDVPTEAPTRRPDNCPQHYVPVCGKDGKTYGNGCLLGLTGVEFDYEGECRPRNCPQYYDPVCGKDGKTYGNGCLLAAAGVEFDYDGECEEKPTDAPTEEPTRRPDNCPQHYIPVCGKDGKTYGNACLLGLAGVEFDYEGECRPRNCPQYYDPVCGKDGKTYGNGCLLAAAGVEFDYDGECVDPTAEPTPDPTDFPEILCPEIYDPVCAKGGKTYGNGCLLGEAGAEFDYAGECVASSEAS